MTVDLIDSLLNKMQRSTENLQTFLKSLMTVNLINDYLVIEKDEMFECYYQMNPEPSSFYYTTLVKS